MPCEKPVIAPIDDECCFSCYTEGRGVYQAPIAVVLHEVDEHIEALNNRLENCCHDNPDCHSSFHYGVGHNGRIINWVDPDNAAWSFDPINSDQNCGTCGWSIATQEGTGVDPNLYTINIAISTGILSFDQSSPNSLAQNNYTENQYEAVTRLVGWLAETYGIIVNQNNIWRHCDELDDFPGGCCCNEENCPECETYSDFLEDVQECIDSTELACPVLCDCMCDADVTPGSPAYIFGSDAECNVCGRYAFDAQALLPDLCQQILDSVDPATTNAIPGVTMLLGRDCESYFLPELCPQILALPVDNQPSTLLLLGQDAQQDCVVNPIIPLCDPAEYSASALSIGDDSNEVGFHRMRPSMPYREGLNGESLIPADDGVIALDADQSPVIFTLTNPGPCDPNIFYVKRKDCNGGNTVTVNGGASTIDGLASIQLGTPGPYGSCGESVALYWTGTEWLII